MVNLEYKNGLLYTDLTLIHEGKEVIVNDVIVDTGASHSIISPVFLELLDTEIALDDEIVNAYGLGGGMCSSLRKRIDKISCNDIYLTDFKIDFGEIDPQERINGLLGLDFLKKANTVIDLVTNNIMTK
ncbi:retropepsin-like aspartic protease [Clostridium sp.]|uniref:retropepsin-like aspartic protease n=1 Tax=Clostridium sp. TaxID=1506 RepID=UPI002FCC2EBA